MQEYCRFRRAEPRSLSAWLRASAQGCRDCQDTCYYPESFDGQGDRSGRRGCRWRNSSTACDFRCGANVGFLLAGRGARCNCLRVGTGAKGSGGRVDARSPRQPGRRGLVSDVDVQALGDAPIDLQRRGTHDGVTCRAGGDGPAMSPRCARRSRAGPAASRAACGRAPGFEHRRAVRRLEPDDVAGPNSGLNVSERCGRRSGCQPDLPGHQTQPSGWRRVERSLDATRSSSMVRGRPDRGSSDSPSRRPLRKRRRQTVRSPGATALLGKPGAGSCGNDPPGRSGDDGPDFPTVPPRSKPATGRPLPRAIPLRSTPIAIRT